MSGNLWQKLQLSRHLFNQYFNRKVPSQSGFQGVYLLRKAATLFVCLFVLLSGARLSGNMGCLPFTWKTRNFQLENQTVRIIPYGVLLKL